MSSLIFESLNNIELRVLLGAQAGAALPLTSESTVIGSDEQCDVILQSPGVALRHARLSVTADGFSLNALDGGIVASSGAPAAPPWRFGTTVYLGDVGITIDRSNAAWTAASPPQTTANTQQKINIGNISQWPAAALQRWKQWVLLAGILVTLSVGTQLILTRHSQAAVEEKLSQSNIRSIETLIARHGGDAALKLDTTAKKPVVRGYLPTVKQVNALRRDLSGWRQTLVVDVQAEDVLLAASRHFLIREHSALKVLMVNGKAQLSGLGTRKTDVARLAQDLKKTVTGLDGVNAAFVDRDRLDGWLRAWRKDVSASGRTPGPVHIETAANGDLELRGKLAPQSIQQLRDTLTRRSLQKNMLLALHIAIATPAESSGRPPAVRAFSAGSVPYVFLTNGRRVMIGGAVNGFHLIAINETGPVFEKQGG